MAIPEAYGGAGFGYVELVVVLEEMGRSLLCAPYFSTVALAANALLSSGDEAAKAEYLPGIASGETIATLAFTEESGRWELDGITMEAKPAGDGWVLDGTKSYVLDGHTANLILVAARTANGLSLFAVAGDADGLTRTPLSTMDQTRKQAKLTFAATPARLVGEEGAAGPVLSKTLDLAAVALAAEQVGGAQRVLDMSVEYAKNRIQFGRPIGSFQAIKHKCADMLLRGRVGEIGRLLRRLGGGRGQRRAPRDRLPGEGVLLGGVLPRCRGEHPDPRRHRLHLGARRPPVLQAGQVVRADPRRPLLPPRAPRPAHRHLMPSGGLWCRRIRSPGVAATRPRAFDILRAPEKGGGPII